ncbi:MAG TPA: alpha/beta fold hydrolase [Mycobacteriales bacterium]|nr:alpha/beta fold hydrolase [Mycobacteriales bacterium]
MSDDVERPADPRGTRVRWPGSTVSAGGRTLHVARAVSEGAPPAVFVHGLGGESANWVDLMELLQGHLDAHAVDLPGHGRSPAPGDGRYDLDAHVAAVEAYVDHLGAGPVHLFGNSTGGAIGTRLAAQRPDLVRSLTLVSPALPNPRPVKGSDPRLAMLLVPGLASVVQRRLERADPEARARAVIDICFADPSRIPPHRLREAIAEVERRQKLPWALPAFVGTLRGLVRSYVDRSPRNLWLQAAQVKSPTLLIYGRRDRLVALSTATRAAATFPHNRLLVLDDVGHVAQIEAAPVVAAAVLELLAEVGEPLIA